MNSSLNITDETSIISIPTINLFDPENAPNIQPDAVSNSISSIRFTPEQLKGLLIRKDRRFRIMNNDTKQKLAFWWRSFGFISKRNENDQFETIQGFIACLKCSHTFRYGTNSGTKHFIEHADRCYPSTSSSASAQGVGTPKSAQSTLNQVGFRRKTTLTTKDKDELNNLCAKWICEDLRPFTILEDYGFQQLADLFMRIGNDYGLLDIQEIMPSRRTVSRKVIELADQYRIQVKEELAEPLKSKAVTIAPDFWQTKHNKQPFLGLCATYVTSSFEHKSIDLFCRPFNGTKSFDLVTKVLISNLSEFGITSLTDVNIISDRGSNFVKAFNDYDPIYCFGHRLNNVLKICFFQQQNKKKQRNDSTKNLNVSTTETTTASVPSSFDDDLSTDSESYDSESDLDEEKRSMANNCTPLVVLRYKKTSTQVANEQKVTCDDIPSEAKHVLFVIKQVKRLVKYVKLVGLNQEIKDNGGGTLHQSTVVRWLSMTDLLESVVKSFKITRRLLIGKAKQQLIMDLDLQCLKQLCVVLRPFKHVVTCIQKGDGPSLHLVSMSFITLKEVMSSFETVKNYFLEHIQEKEKQQLFDDCDDIDLSHELPGVRWFRERLLLLLNEMVVLDMRHIAATLLHPRYKSLKKIPDQINDQCYKYVRHQVRHIRLTMDIEEQIQPESTEPSTKRLKVHANIFSRFESGNSSSDVNMCNGSGNESEEFEYDYRKSDELDRYILLDVDKSQSIEPLPFWRNHQSKFPFLSRYARSVFSIPATTTNVEREFSTAGFILNERRTCLRPETLDNILLIRSVEKALRKT